MLKRYELHNHTTESDASITCAELIAHMEKDRVDVFAITDHNTISGHRVVKRLLESQPHAIQCVYGMEYTTYYGHILCLNLHEYVPWDSINRHKPELLFEACQAAGALTGIAHPFSYGAPFARGCRFEMTVSDFSHVDFIEIFNDPEPLREVNEPGLRWWEDLVLGGEKLAATCGMDLHGPWNMAMQFATYLEGGPGGDPAQELAEAIHSGQTWVSKGMILRPARADGGWRFTLEDVNNPGFMPGSRYIATVRGAYATREYDVTDGALVIPDADLPAGKILIPKLYRNEATIENLICVAPVLRR